MEGKETAQYRWFFRFNDSIETDNYNKFVGQGNLYYNGTYYFYANGVGGDMPASPPGENETGEWEKHPVDPSPPKGFEQVTKPRTT